MTGCLLLVIAWRPWSQRGRSDGDALDRTTGGACGVAFAASYGICHLGLHGLPASAQLEAWEWLLVLVPLAALAGVADSVFKPSRSLPVVAITCLACATGWLIVPGFEPSPWTWRIGIGAVVITLYGSQRHFVQALAGLALPLAWVMVGSFGLPVLIASANAKFGFFSTSIAAASGAAALVWLYLREMVIVRSAVPVVSVLFPSLFSSGHFNDYGEVSTVAFLLLIAAPLSLWFGLPLTKRYSKSWAPTVVGLACVLLFCCAAVYIAWPALNAVPAY